MKVPKEDRKLLEDFVGESLGMLNSMKPFLNASIDKPEHEELLAKVTTSCFRLFHSISGTSGFLGLNKIMEPANAAEYLLDRIKSGILTIQPEYVALLAEACQFMEKGLQLVLAENSDDRLGPSSDKLTSAFLQAANQEWHLGKTANGTLQISDEMHETFIWETDELLETAEQEFVLWDFVAIDQPRVNELLLSLHRMKRNFALFELNDLERISQAMESTIERFLKGEFFQGEYPERVFLRAIDVMRAALAEYAQSGNGNVIGLDDQLAALQSLMRQPIGELLVKAGFVASDTVEQALLQQKQVEQKPRRLGEVLVDMGEVTSEQINSVLQEQHRKREEAQQAEARQHDLDLNSTPDYPGQVLARNDLRMSGDKLQQLLDLTDKIVEEDKLSGNTNQYVPQLKSLVQILRLLPVKELTPRLKRVVHDLSLKYSKKVQFIIKGGNEEVSREVLEALGDPLLHLLRNAVEHGLESPEERVKAGKKESGRLALLVLKRGGELWASVEDDGRGLDIKKIGRMALSNGLIPEEQADQLSSNEVADLIFQLGFSTAESVTDSSGRGVGMDAVKSSLNELGGTVDVLSKPGKGTRVTLRIPWEENGDLG